MAAPCPSPQALKGAAPMERQESEWLQRAQAGDGWAFERLVEPYHGALLSLACSMLSDRAEAQDACQEALLAAFRALPRFRLESNFFTWLYRIAVNKTLKAGKRARRAPARLAPPPAAAPDKALLDAELGRQLERAQEGLSPQERMAFALCHRQGYALAQAALFMECSPGAVKSYLFRARRKMQEALRPYLEES